MTNLNLADNTNPLINKCKKYSVKYLKEILYQYKIINNIKITKSQLNNIKITKSELNKLNKSQMYNFVDKNNIDIDKYHKYNIKKDMKDLMCDLQFYNYGNNIHKKYKNRNLVNYFTNDDYMFDLFYNTF